MAEVAADAKLKEVRGALDDDGPVECVVSETKGRILVSRCCFSPGDTIYIEPPLHIIEEDESSATYLRLETLSAEACLDYAARWYWYALNCLTALDYDDRPPLPDCCIISEGLQQQLLLLCAPDENVEAMPALRTLLEELGGPPEAAEKVWKLLQVWKFNSFECGEDPVSSAVYFRTSFHSHDCDPNANWTTGSKDSLELRARRAIEAGEEVTISYLSDEELFEATSQRQFRLKFSKAFLCGCRRCSAPFDSCRAIRCCEAGSRQLATNAEGAEDGKLISSCSASSPCEWPAARTTQVLQKEDLLVRLYRQHADSDISVRLDLSRRFANAAEQLFPRHWITERLWKWIVEGCTSKFEAKTFELKRLQFLEEAYAGAVRNSYTAWVRQSWAMWTLSSCGVLQQQPPPTEEVWRKAKQTGALAALHASAEVLRNLNGSEDKYYLHVHGHFTRLSAAYSSAAAVSEPASGGYGPM